MVIVDIIEEIGFFKPIGLPIEKSGAAPNTGGCYDKKCIGCR
jgi:hypothetical protein